MTIDDDAKEVGDPRRLYCSVLFSVFVPSSILVTIDDDAEELGDCCSVFSYVLVLLELLDIPIHLEHTCGGGLKDLAVGLKFMAISNAVTVNGSWSR
ncbi:unnamed protein product [Ilex paraguariensis]|uniref:Uncharacterized protein n=1 Tax=Ilex paraguariensis TaxID=185542 RepID=A0ABC8R8F0_9AQUA